jgi:hypothetical protein
MERIGEVREAAIGARRRGIELSRHAHAQGLMRPLVIEPLEEGIEARLLLEKIRRRGLVASVLSVRCMRSCRPFCSGMPRLDRSS